MAHQHFAALAWLPRRRLRRHPTGHVRVYCGTGCDQRCLTCPFPDDAARVFRPANEVRRSLEEARRRGAKGVLFGGGEPTAHPEIAALLRDARGRGLALGLLTNGVRLAHPTLRERLRALGLGRVHVHVYHSDPEVHRAMARGDADLEATLRAMRALRTDGVTVLATVPLWQRNISDLPRLCARLSEAGVEELHLTTPVRLRPPEQHAPLRVLGEALRQFLGDGRFRRVTFDRAPLCAAPTHEHMQRYARVPQRDPILPPPADPAAVAWPCRGCSALGVCERPVPRGAPRAEIASAAPFSGEVSNSFNYVLHGAVAFAKSLERCPIRAGEVPVPALDPDRGLLLFHRGRILRAHTETADFLPAEIRRIRDVLGQIYLDVSDKALLDDFSKDLRPLRPAAACAGCPSRPECAGAFEPRDLEVDFTASEAEVTAVLAELRGRVLDVGVGHPHSLQKLLPGEPDRPGSGGVGASPGDASALPFQYIGIEPDEARIRLLRDRFPALSVRCAAAEDRDLAERVGAGDAPFDHVVLLRSYNHLQDLVDAFDNLVGILRPGGTVLVVENTAFALVRGRRKIAVLEKMEQRGDAPFEHYRNHTSAEALEVLSTWGLEPIRHRPAGPSTANQWILWMRKPA